MVAGAYVLEYHLVNYRRTWRGSALSTLVMPLLTMFGFGIGGVLTLLPIAWADYFGRANFAAIRGIALSVQVIAQAAGPLLSGALHDWTGSYHRALQCFAVLSCLSVVSGVLPSAERNL